MLSREALFRIFEGSFKTSRGDVIHYYAPTNYSNEDDKVNFYDRLQSIVDKCPENNLTILDRRPRRQSLNRQHIFTIL